MKTIGNTLPAALRMAALLIGLAGATALRAEAYTIFLYEADAEFAARADEQRGPAYWGSFAAYGETLKAAGVLRGGTALHAGGKAQTVQVKGGQRTVKAGAFAKSPISLGGYFIIEVPNLEAALSWAEQAPNAATGAVEVRPAYPVPGRSM